MCPSSLHIFSAAELCHICDFRQHHFLSHLLTVPKLSILSFFTLKAFSFHPTGYLLPLQKVQDKKGVSGNLTIVNHLELHQRYPVVVSFGRSGE
jgi:hypothetical protein